MQRSLIHREMIPAVPHNASHQMNSLLTQAILSCQSEMVIQAQNLSGGKDILLLVVMVVSGCGCAEPGSAPGSKALAHVPMLPIVGHACTGSPSRQPCLISGPDASDKDELGSHTGQKLLFRVGS